MLGYRSSLVSNNLKQPDSPEYVATSMLLEASPTESPRFQCNHQFSLLANYSI